MKIDLTNFTPITALTTDIIDNMVIHSDKSSLRRATAVKEFVVEDATETVPILYYVFDGTYTETTSGNVTTKTPNYIIHTLIVDIQIYLLTATAAANEITITYVSAQGTAPQAKIVTMTNSSYTLTTADIPTLTAEGYTFNGWLKTGSETVLTTADTLTADTTLTAKWTANA